MSIRGLLAKHNALKPRVRRASNCGLTFACRWHVEHQDGSLSHCTDWPTALDAALTYEPLCDKFGHVVMVGVCVRCGIEVTPRTQVPKSGVAHHA